MAGSTNELFQSSEEDDPVSPVFPISLSHPVSPHLLEFSPGSNPSVPFVDFLGPLLVILEYDANGICKCACFCLFIVF